MPIPYPNIGLSSNTNGGSTSVKVDHQMLMAKGAIYMVTTGDEPRNAGGGVVRNKFKGESEYMMYSFDVKLEGKNACRLMDPLFHNARNTIG